MVGMFFYGPEGRIEARLHTTTKKDPHSPAALILHSHPQLGGSMDDPAVDALAKAFIKNDCTVMCINFRGVGKSEGEFDNGLGELIDAAVSLDWLESYIPSASSICVSGFSFGAWIAMQLTMRRPEVDHFVVASPPTKKYDFSFFHYARTLAHMV